jgi:pimeloyl-ACP methyl ester carboxylesterase
MANREPVLRQAREMNGPLSVLLCLPSGTPFADPGPELTMARDVDLVAAPDEQTRGVVGWSSGGWDALAYATDHPELERLVIVSLPYPDDDVFEVDPETIADRTLLLYGNADPSTGSRHATSWQKCLPNARLEMVPGGGHDLLEPMWHRTLAFVAPRRKRL